MNSRDKLILEKILLYVCSNDQIENEVALFVQTETEEEITKEDFHNWIPYFDL